MNLTKWVRDHFPHRAHEVIDKRLITGTTTTTDDDASKLEGVQESNSKQLLLNCLLVPMMEVALSCVVDSPDERSNMRDSLLRLKQTKVTFLRNCSISRG